MRIEIEKDIFLRQVQQQAQLKFGSPHFEILQNHGYSDVIFRLGKVLPTSVMLDWFSNNQEMIFPFLRVDSKLIVIRDDLDLLQLDKNDDARKKRYEYITQLIAKTLTWIDIGWGGLEKFAASDSSKSWTSGAGNEANAKERAQYILTEGKKRIDQVVAKYRVAREIYDPKYGDTDVFRQYNIEYLLRK